MNDDTAERIAALLAARKPMPGLLAETQHTDPLAWRSDSRINPDPPPRAEIGPDNSTRSAFPSSHWGAAIGRGLSHLGIDEREGTQFGNNLTRALETHPVTAGPIFAHDIAGAIANQLGKGSVGNAALIGGGGAVIGGLGGAAGKAFLPPMTQAGRDMGMGRLLDRLYQGEQKPITGGTGEHGGIADSLNAAFWLRNMPGVEKAGAADVRDSLRKFFEKNKSGQ